MSTPLRKSVMQQIRLERLDLDVVEEGVESDSITFLRGGTAIKAIRKPQLVPRPLESHAINQKLADAIASPGRDVLAEKILAGHDDPDYESIAALLPQVGSWDFIATPRSKWKFLIWPDGRIGIQTSFHGDYMTDLHFVFDPAAEGFPYGTLPSAQGLLDGHLPASRMLFKDPAGSGTIWEHIAFARTADNDHTTVYIRVNSTTLPAPLYFTACSPEHKTVDELKAMAYQKAMRIESGTVFYEELFKLAHECVALFKNAMTIDIPEERTCQASIGGILKAFNSYVGAAPRYGVTRYLADDGPASESFPPTTTTMVDCCLEWGFFEKAREFLEYYLSRYVKPSGQLNHRDNGASVSEHGMLLGTIARFVAYTRDGEFLARHADCVKNICEWLLAARREGKRGPPDSKAFGLICGCPEDDLRNWKTNYWYSGNCWACRGLVEAAKLFISHGGGIDLRLVEYGKQLESESESFRKDIVNSLHGSSVHDGALLFVPPFPGYAPPFDTMLSEIFYEGDERETFFLSSYVNYRVYPEMLSAEVMGDELEEAVAAFRAEKGGEVLGMTRIRMPQKTMPALNIDRFDLPWGGDLMIDDWPIYNQLEALLRMDKVEKFLMTYYAHMAYHQARDTFFAAEHTDLIRLFPPHCVPSQLTIPLATRWMLVFEERDREVLWLGKAIPRHWLSDGKVIELAHAPTRWGKVCYRVESHVADGRISARISMEGNKMPQEILLRLRCPQGAKVIDVDDGVGNLQIEIDRDRELLRIIPTDGQDEFGFEITTS